MGVEMWNGPKIAKHTGFDPERRYKEERALLEVVAEPNSHDTPSYILYTK